MLELIGGIIIGLLIAIFIVVWIVAFGIDRETIQQKIINNLTYKKGYIAGLSEEEENYSNSLKSDFEDKKIK